LKALKTKNQKPKTKNQKPMANPIPDPIGFCSVIRPTVSHLRSKRIRKKETDPFSGRIFLFLIAIFNMII
jgi:hypothetical protein